MYYQAVSMKLKRGYLICAGDSQTLKLRIAKGMRPCNKISVKPEVFSYLQPSFIRIQQGQSTHLEDKWEQVTFERSPLYNIHDNSVA